MLVLSEKTRAQVAVVEAGSENKSNRRPASPVLAMAAGLAIVAVAVVILVHAPRAVFAGVTLGGPSDVTVQMATYEPGESSGWHSHSGMHAVLVVSGTLTVYDGQCQPRVVGPGEMYVGGRDVHLATNSTALPVVMTVTYMFPAGASHTGFHIPAAAPSGCAIG